MTYIDNKLVDSIDRNDNESEECLDFDCSITLDDRVFVQAQLDDIMKIHKLVSSLLIRDVDDKMIKTSEYVTIDVYIDDVDSSHKFVISRFMTNIHLVNNFKINLLLEIDVLESQKMILDFDKHLVKIDVYQDFTTLINVINKANSHIKRIIRARKTFIVQLRTIVNVLIIYHNELLNDKNFLFESQCSKYLEHDDEVFAHIMNASLFFIQIHNAIEALVILLRRARLDIVIEYN